MIVTYSDEAFSDCSTLKYDEKTAVIFMEFEAKIRNLVSEILGEYSEENNWRFKDYGKVDVVLAAIEKAAAETGLECRIGYDTEWIDEMYCCFIFLDKIFIGSLDLDFYKDECHLDLMTLAVNRKVHEFLKTMAQ